MKGMAFKNSQGKCIFDISKLCQNSIARSYCNFSSEIDAKEKEDNHEDFVTL